MEFSTEELNMLSFPMVAGVLTWLVTQILGIVYMIKFKPDKKNRKIEEIMEDGTDTTTGCGMSRTIHMMQNTSMR